MQNSVMLFTFFVFKWKYPFWANLVQKMKMISLSWNLVPRLIRICRIQWWCSLFLFLIENTYFEQIWLKKLKLSVQGETPYFSQFKYAEFNGDVHSFCFWSEIPFLGRFGPKNQNYQFKLKFGTYTNSNMQNSMLMFTFSGFDWKYPFWANLVQKVKIISWSWNLVPRLNRVCRIQWWCLLFLSLMENTYFGQIWSIKLKLSVQGETRYLKWFKYAEFNGDVHFFRFWPEIPCLGQCGPKNKNCHLGQIWSKLSIFTVFFSDQKCPFWKNLV